MTRFVFTHANLLDGEHAAKADATVVVDAGRIAFVGTGAGETNATDRVIDCRGRTLMPGMTQGHFHSTYREVGLPLMPPLGLENPPAYQAYIAAANAETALRCGYTSVVGANEAFDIDPSLARAIDEGLLVGPRVIAGSRDMITTGDSNDTVPWWWEATASGGVRVCDGAEGFRKGVREEIRRGAEIVKLFATGGHGVRLAAEVASMTREELGAAIAAAHGLGKRARAHVATKRRILECVELGIDVVDHGDGLDEECIQAMVENDVILIPSLHLYLAYLHQIGDVELKTEDAADFRAMCEILPAAVEAGLKICLGDDYGTKKLPHGSYGRELAMYVEHTGLDALEILRWATVNGGALVGRPDLGRIEDGAVADLVLVDGDPSQDITVLIDRENIHAVMRDGLLLVDQAA